MRFVVYLVLLEIIENSRMNVLKNNKIWLKHICINIEVLNVWIGI